MRSDDAAEFKSGCFTGLIRKRNIPNEDTTANSHQLNGIEGRGDAMIESPGKVASFQLNRVFSVGHAILLGVSPAQFSRT